MNNILLISSTAKKTGRLDGVTIKSRVLEKYLEDVKSINLFTIDSDNYKKDFLSIIYKFMKFYKKSNKVIICSSSPGASIILRFFKFINTKKDIYYFVAGGVLVDNIKKGKYNINLYRNLKKIYVESNDMVQGFKDLGIYNVEKLNNFRKVDDFENKYEVSEKIKFVYYGRVVKEKGVEEAINLINRLSNDKYNISLDIYGQCKPEYKEYLKRLVNSEIRFCGALKPDNKNEYEILSQYDIFIFPTEHKGEGLPGALIDAYISGLAIIASNWKYASEYISDGFNGYIFEYKNYDDMYEKTKQLIESDNIKYFKENSKELSKLFLVDNVLDSFISEIKG